MEVDTQDHERASQDLFDKQESWLILDETQASPPRSPERSQLLGRRLDQERSKLAIQVRKVKSTNQVSTDTNTRPIQFHKHLWSELIQYKKINTHSSRA